MAGPIANSDSYGISAGESALLSEITKGLIFNGTTFVFANIDTGLLGNDSDTDGDTLTITSVSDGTTSTDLNGGTVTVTADDGIGKFTISADGTISFDASSGYEYLTADGEPAIATLTYTVSDGNGGFATSTVSVTVNGVDGDGVSAADDAFATDEETAFTSAVGELLANDSSYNGNHSIVAVTDVAGSDGGIFSIDAAGTLTFDPNGEFEDVALNESRTTSVTYTVVAENGETAEATASVTVNGLNATPEANNDGVSAGDDSYEITAGESIALSEFLPTRLMLTESGWAFVGADTRVLVNDSDIDGDSLTITKVTVGGVETLLNGAAINIVGEDGIGAFTLSPEGDVSFDASAGYAELRENESSATSIEYTVSDGNGGEATATITVTVNGVDGDGISASDDAFATDEVTTLTSAVGELLANDSSYNGNHSIVAVTDVAGSNGGLFTIDSSGTLSFDPNGEFQYLALNETLDTSVTYTVIAENGETSEATATVTVSGLNDGVTALDDSYTIQAGESQTLGRYYYQLEFTGQTFEFVSEETRLLANDVDPDTSDELSITEVNGQALVDGEITIAGDNGGLFTISEDGTIAFDASTGEFELLAVGDSVTSSVSYRVVDGNGGTDTATVSVEVSGGYKVNAVDDFISLDDGPLGSLGWKDQISTTELIGNDNLAQFVSNIDLRGSDFHVFGLDTGLNEINAQGRVKLGDGNTYQTSFAYTITDHLGETDSATVQVTYGNTLSNPTVFRDYVDVQMNEGEVFTLDLNQFLGGRFGDTYTLDENYGTGTALRFDNLVGNGFTVTDLGNNIYEISGPDTAFNEMTRVDGGAAARLIAKNGTQEVVKFDFHSFGTSLELATGQQLDLAQDDYIQLTESQIGSTFRSILNNDTSDVELVSLERVGPSNYFDDYLVGVSYVSDDQLSTYGRIGLWNSSPGENELDAGEVVTHSFEYTVVDAEGNYDTATVTFEITGQQDGIYLNGGANDVAKVYLSEDSTLTFDDSILVNQARDLDADGVYAFGVGLSSANLDDSLLQGSLMQNSDGSYTYDPTVAFDSLSATDSQVLERIDYDIVSVDGSVMSTRLEIYIQGADDPIV